MCDRILNSCDDVYDTSFQEDHKQLTVIEGFEICVWERACPRIESDKSISVEEAGYSRASPLPQEVDN